MQRISEKWSDVLNSITELRKGISHSFGEFSFKRAGVSIMEELVKVVVEGRACFRNETARFMFSCRSP